MLFVVAELFRTMRAGEASIGRLGKALGMQTEGDLPHEQKQQGKPQKTPCVNARQKDERGEHHGVIPIVDAAGAAAFVLHKPSLKRAEEEDTDHVADRIKETDQKQDAAVDQLGIIKDADQGIQHDPNQCHKGSGAGRLQGGSGCFGGNKV